MKSKIEDQTIHPALKLTNLKKIKLIIKANTVDPQISIQEFLKSDIAVFTIPTSKAELIFSKYY